MSTECHRSRRPSCDVGHQLLLTTRESPARPHNRSTTNGHMRIYARPRRDAWSLTGSPHLPDRSCRRSVVPAVRPRHALGEETGIRAMDERAELGQHGARPEWSRGSAAAWSAKARGRAASWNAGSALGRHPPAVRVGHTNRRASADRRGAIVLRTPITRQ